MSANGLRPFGKKAHGEELTGVAAQLTGGHYEVRAVRRGDDEIGRLADTLNRMSAEIMKSDQVKKDFLSNISHELRTPPTAIKGWTETILAGPPSDRLETRQGLEVIAHETNRLIGLVEELLDFSRLQSGRVTLDLRPVDVGRLVGEVVRQFAARAREGGLELSTEVPGDVPAEGLRCLADGDRLRQVLINLVDNAVKFTGPGGSVLVSVRPGRDVPAVAGEPTVADRSTAADEPIGAGGLTIAVSDTGCGISPDDLPRVTGKFYKADSKKPGSGLGLSIVHEIVRLHGGRLTVASELGQGTMATVWLPAEPPGRELPPGRTTG
ncbi:MAG: HAMP domain-containing sensor histidine kinase [Bacillota bacterium]